MKKDKKQDNKEGINEYYTRYLNDNDLKVCKSKKKIS